MRGSVRTRTTVAATAVVAVALVVAGLAVVLLLRSNLSNQAELQAEVTARQLASRLAGGTAPAALDLPDDDRQPVRIVDAQGKVLAVSDGLTAINNTPVRPPLGRTPTASSGPTATDDDESEDKDSDDDNGQQSGKVAEGEAAYSTGTATVEGRTAEYRFASLGVILPGGNGEVTVQAGAELATAENAVGTVTRAMLIGLPLLLLVIAGVTWTVTRRALAPVEAIRGELGRITAARDLSRRVPVPESKDEVARLARTTNETLTALETSVAQQRGFVADASHELRNPIASLRTQLEIAAAHPELLELDELIADTIRLQQLTADLLFLARLDAGERPPPERIEIAQLVHEEIARRPAGKRPVVEILGEPVVLGNRARLARVLGNLVDNAERHARDDVRVVVQSEGAEAVVQVIDDGPGVPAADRERIFERFVRLDDARSRDDGGAGLGLAIARDVVRASAGTLTVGAAPGGGAAFEIRLPIGR
jgi:signal transduction histidine kinase